MSINKLSMEKAFEIANFARAFLTNNAGLEITNFLVTQDGAKFSTQAQGGGLWGEEDVLFRFAETDIFSIECTQTGENSYLTKFHLSLGVDLPEGVQVNYYSHKFVDVADWKKYQKLNCVCDTCSLPGYCNACPIWQWKRAH